VLVFWVAEGCLWLFLVFLVLVGVMALDCLTYISLSLYKIFASLSSISNLIFPSAHLNQPVFHFGGCAEFSPAKSLFGSGFANGFLINPPFLLLGNG
jgi:hypothetical protein